MKTKARAFKDRIYGELTKTAKALGNARRLEIIDILAQGPYTVEALARYTGMTVANTSQHLQVLKGARLVEINRKGNYIYYHLAGQNVYEAWIAIRELGMAHNAEIGKLIQDFRREKAAVAAVSAEELVRKVKSGDVILLDVRSEEEYKRGHIHRAISTPIDQLEKQLKGLPKKKEIIAYCSGSFCIMADEATDFLLKKGYKARRMKEGYHDWLMKGLPVEVQDVEG